MSAATVTLSSGRSVTRARSALYRPTLSEVVRRGGIDAAEFAQSMFAALTPTGAGRLRIVTLTDRPGRSVRFSLARFVRVLSESGGSVVAFLDRGERGLEHWHAVLECGEDFDVKGAWVRLTGARLDAQACRRVRSAFDLEKAVHYAAVKQPKVGPARDLRRDVVATGLLKAVWDVFVCSDGSQGVPAPKGAGKALQRPGVEGCAWCAGPIPPGRRAHTLYCKASHRVRAAERRKSERAVREMVPQPLFLDTTHARGTKAAQARSRGGVE